MKRLPEPLEARLPHVGAYTFLSLTCHRLRAMLAAIRGWKRWSSFLLGAKFPEGLAFGGHLKRWGLLVSHCCHQVQKSSSKGGRLTLAYNLRDTVHQHGEGMTARASVSAVRKLVPSSISLFMQSGTPSPWNGPVHT